MKNSRIFNRLLILIITTSLAACGPAKENLSDLSKAAFDDPVVHTEQLALNADRDTYLKIFKNDAWCFPLYLEPAINVADFRNYYNAINDTGIYDGIRIYPAFRKNHIFYIMCLADTTDTINNPEDGYFILDRSYYSRSNFSVDDTVSSSEVLKYHRNYLDSIYIDKKKQSEYTDKDYIKISRFYKSSEIERLINQNSPTDDPNNGDDNYLKFETGYVNSKMAAKFRQRSGENYTDTQIHGFTVIIHLQDSNGFSIIDPNCEYSHGNYRGAYLEVGNPCPPRCGTMHDAK